MGDTNYSRGTAIVETHGRMSFRMVRGKLCINAGTVCHVRR
ncbi:hypothetical protein ACLB1T_01210 [Escherichia coli]